MALTSVFFVRKMSVRKMNVSRLIDAGCSRLAGRTGEPSAATVSAAGQGMPVNPERHNELEPATCCWT